MGRGRPAEQGSAALVGPVAVGRLVQVDTDMETTPAAAAPARTTVGGTREAASETATPGSEVGVIHLLQVNSLCYPLHIAELRLFSGQHHLHSA